ncbi:MULTISPECIES: C-terminal binding protein [Tabrizicola]|uniref:C-terminal binding protein n=1 Tax=Tabrizicola TaxID=1443919 RepID=UPI00108138E5|nr:MULTISPECIES: C-terminal binding protein [Paracoccaceae]
MKRVVVTDATFPTVEKEEAAARAAGAILERHACRTAEEVAAAVRGADVVVVQFAPLTRDAIAGLAPGATVIRYGVGYNNLDVAALNDHGVKAAYVPDYCTAEVADHTAASILALLRKLPALDASVRRGEWAAVAISKPLKSFGETVVGFLGFGRIAQEVASRLAPFGFRFLAHDPYFKGDFPGLTLCDLPTLLAGCDALTLHAPATPETTRIINAATLAQMRATAILVNTARGDLIDEAALAAALAAGTLAGAALDVFQTEPLPDDSPLRQAPNLLLGPHAAWYSDVAVERLQSLVADEITRALTGQGVRKPVPGSTAN